MASYSLIVPLIGQSTKFQPVYVDDVALAVEKVLEDSSLIGVFELGGPEIFTFRETIEKMLLVVRRKRFVLAIPFSLAHLMASGFTLINRLSLGLVKPPFTVDNVEQLKTDNIVGKTQKSFEDLGIKPKNIDTIIPLYLYSFRPYGQYNDITRSADKINEQKLPR
jgi:NADH dehydrogenase